MNIGILSPDGGNFPNLALMKISAYHKKQGDTVNWVDFSKHYDKVYVSKIFTFTPDIKQTIRADIIEKGGTGYDVSKKLPHYIDDELPDYALYPLSKWYDGETAYGFLTRGCIRRCSWCVVPEKEGTIKNYRDIEDVLEGKKKAILMDNNILASECCVDQLEKIIKIGCRVDFNQGLDARIIASNDEIALLLASLKWLKPLRLACDSYEIMPAVEEAVNVLRMFKIKPNRLFAYVLLTEISDSYERIMFLKKMNTTPFAQPYRDFTQNQIIPQWQQDMARWCNHKGLLHSCDFKDYQPRKGFVCGDYF